MRRAYDVTSVRAAEGAALAELPEGALMQRAAAGLATVCARLLGRVYGARVLLLVGSGDNGGDALYGGARLAARGARVEALLLGSRAHEAGLAALRRAGGTVVESVAGRPPDLVVDGITGIGGSGGLREAAAAAVAALPSSALVVAVDVPSGVDADTGEVSGPAVRADVTVTFGALKPAHLLFPAMHKCGRVVLADIGIEAEAAWREIAPPDLPPVDPGAHKYSRGLVHALAGEMPGAIALAATAAARAGAGYVRVSTSRHIENLPAAVVQVGTAEVNDERIGCLLVGPGMGVIPPLVTLALTSKAPKVLDADAISHLGEPNRLKGQDAIVTPHEGEFRRLFGEIDGTKPERALEAARRSGAVIVYKGADTVVASPDGRVGFRPPAPAWLASAGTGDVLAGIIAALRARGMPAFEASCAGVWLQARAAEIAGPQMIADDLAQALGDAIGSLA